MYQILLNVRQKSKNKCNINKSIKLSCSNILLPALLPAPSFPKDGSNTFPNDTYGLLRIQH